jgi:hypothetical protein
LGEQGFHVITEILVLLPHPGPQPINTSQRILLPFSEGFFESFNLLIIRNAVHQLGTPFFESDDKRDSAATGGFHEDDSFLQTALRMP